MKKPSLEAAAFRRLRQGVSCRIGRFFAAGLMRKRDAVAVFPKTEHSAGPFGGGVYNDSSLLATT